jgi:hypothetical protein
MSVTIDDNIKRKNYHSYILSFEDRGVSIPLKAFIIESSPSSNSYDLMKHTNVHKVSIRKLVVFVERNAKRTRSKSNYFILIDACTNMPGLALWSTAGIKRNSMNSELY